MNKYAILLTQGHNRVFYNASKELAICELKITLNNFTDEYTNVKQENIMNVTYITFEIDIELDTDKLKLICKLSFMYALFKLANFNNRIYLEPLALTENEFVPQSISSILKYTGKTNELFTRMLINIATSSSIFYNESHLKLLDPVAGKGTTLYEALIYGYDSYGIEVSDKVVLEAYNYTKKFLVLEKYKHKVTLERISGENKSFKSKKYNIKLAKDKEIFKNNPQIFEIICGNSIYSDKFYKKNSFNLIVGDLPYGVQHGNISKSNQTEFTRNPEKLIQSCSSSWYKVLKQGGAITLSWNTFVLSRMKFTSILEDVGFKVLNSDIYLGFEHRVDNSINRDIIVAIK